MFTLKKGQKSKAIEIYGYRKSSLDRKSPITKTDLSTFTRLNKNSAIVPLNQDDLDFIMQLANLPRVSSYLNIKNLRGELDLTLDKDFITDTDSKYRLLKGANLGHYQLKGSDGYVLESFKSKAKGFWSDLNRIACQQISNQNQARRLKWCLVPPGYVLGNSCNFVGLLNSDDIFGTTDIDLKYLLAVFNSDFMNRRFKLLSANNHISNTEIAEMPLVLPDLKVQQEIGKVALELSKTFNQDTFNYLERQLEGIFGL